MTKNIFDQYLDIYSLKEIIVRGDDIHVLNACGNNALFYKVDSATVRYLIQQGLDVNHENHKGETPLFHTSFYGMEVLLENGANVNAIGISGYNIFTIAFGFYALHQHGSDKLIKLMIDNGAVPCSKDCYLCFYNLFTKEQQNAFDAFSLLTNDNDEFFNMCLAYQNDQKKSC